MEFIDILKTVIGTKDIHDLHNLKSVDVRFQDDNQHDATEFFEYLLDALVFDIPELAFTFKYN